MSSERSREQLLEFLDYLANKGLMAKGTVAARKAAAGKLLGILSDEEAADVTALDLDHVVERFQNLEGKNYTPASLTTYRSRTRSAIEDFTAYLENPLAFRPNVQARERRQKSERKKDNSTSHGTVAPDAGERQSSKPHFEPSSSILPIPIRADKTVYVQGLPFDLTSAEATKIANVIKAMAMPD